MFPHRFFPGTYFAPAYFPPTETPVVPPVPPFPSGGGRRRRPYQPDLPIGPGDDEYWIWFT